MALDGEEFRFHDEGQDWIVSWHSPVRPYPSGTPHGSSATCITPDAQVVIVSSDGESWGLPGGRPEAGEDLRATLDREVLEEACATVEQATLPGFTRGKCIREHEEGLVLVRSIWRADVSLHQWESRHEMSHRLLVGPGEIQEQLSIPDDILPIYLRWFHEVLGIQAA